MRKIVFPEVLIKKSNSPSFPKPISAEIVCKCSEIIMKSQGTTTKIRSKILIFKSDGAYAICKGCGTEVKVPVRVDSLPPLILKN